MRFAAGAKFAVLSFLCILVFALSMSFALSSLLTSAVQQWEWENTAALTRREVELRGLDTFLAAPRHAPLDDRTRHELSRLMRGIPEVVRVKVWDRDATVVWSDEPRLIGQRFPDNDDLKEALAGEVAVEIKTLQGREHAYERPSFTTLAEVYVPIVSKTTGRVIGVVEVYKNPFRLLATIQRARFVICALSLAGALILYLVLFPLVRQVYGRQVREEALEAHAAELEAQVMARNRELEAQREALIQTEKVAAMGQLLAGVSHELNNPLSTIVGYTQLLLRRVGVGPMAEQLQKIAKSAERCTRIVTNFLALARQYPPERQLVQLNQLVDDAVELLEYALRIDSIEVTRRLASDLPHLWADPHQLQQVIVNVLTNAHQALRTVSTRRHLVLTTRFDRAANRIVLEIADSGPGVAADLGARIFDPFFTTKAPGEGTGLGLSLCRGIIDAHDGALRLEPTPGGGATFVIELPAGIPAEAGDGQRAETGLDPASGKTILVVDDERDVAELLAEALQLDGHLVDTANDGAAALDRLLERSYDLVFSDMKMPGMSGMELYEEVARRRPGLERRIIFVTGDTLNPMTKQFLDRTGAASLSKPFGVDAVRRLVPQHASAPSALHAEVALRG
ncbi:MAG: hybrid sensor histidine kinase/response regulator [Candidatus Rokuibacteriota bacterium]